MARPILAAAAAVAVFAAGFFVGQSFDDDERPWLFAVESQDHDLNWADGSGPSEPGLCSLEMNRSHPLLLSEWDDAAGVTTYEYGAAAEYIDDLSPVDADIPCEEMAYRIAVAGDPYDAVVDRLADEYGSARCRFDGDWFDGDCTDGVGVPVPLPDWTMGEGWAGAFTCNRNRSGNGGCSSIETGDQ